MSENLKKKTYTALHISFLPRDAMQSAVMQQYVVCLSICPSVRDVQVRFSHRLKYFENNFKAEKLTVPAHTDLNICDLVQLELN